MSISSLIVRPLLTSEEYNLYYRLADNAFSSHPSEEGAQRWKQIISQSPGFRAEQIRGAFRDDQLLGGYTLHERVLRMGDARISTGCIGAVVTAPDARKQGVASALLQDARAFAPRNNHTLLLLDGIPNFYFRYGYTDVFDVTALEIDRSAVLAQAPTGYHTRPASVDDASAILALYQRHFGGYTGSFERSLEVQAYRLLSTQTPPILALSGEGTIEGYLSHDLDDEMTQGREVAADNWEALLALLHYHAHLFDGNPAIKTLQYFLPLDAPMTQWMIDTLEVPDTSQWNSPAQEWGVRSLVYHHRFTGWMACLADFSGLMYALLPELQARWQRSLARWTGEISLSVAGETCTLRLAGPVLQLAEETTASAYRLELTSQALLQGIFGYRPFTRLPEITALPSDARNVLALLFPVGHTWIPRSDWF